MVVSINIKGLKSLNKKFASIQKGLTIEIPDLTRQQAEDAAKYAAAIAPRHTGALIQGIKSRKGYRKDTYSVKSYLPKHKDGRKRPYHLMMHGLRAPNTSNQNFHGKNPKYMFATLEMLKRRYPALVKRILNNKIRGK